jgi:hypothetical protein
MNGSILVLKTYDGQKFNVDCGIAAKHSEYLANLMEDDKTKSSLTVHLSNPCCASRSVSNVVSYMTFASSQAQPETHNENSSWSTPEGMRDSGELLETTLAAVFLDMKGLLMCLAKIPLILHLTVQAGEADSTAALIEAKADVNGKDADGNTALHLAASGGHTETVQALMEARASVHIRAKVTCGR